MTTKLGDVPAVIKKVLEFNTEYRKSLYTIEVTVGKRLLELYFFEGTIALHKTKWPHFKHYTFDKVTEDFFTETETLLKQRTIHANHITRHYKNSLPPLI